MTFEDIFKTIRQDGKTVASQMDELEKIVQENIPKEHRDLVPNFGKMKKALRDKDPKTALDVYNKAKQALKKVQDIDKDQSK